MDIGYSDAVSGSKEIQMLGLAGKYCQILVDNQPIIRMLTSIYGLNYIPGPWLSEINISKGSSSVLQGYEGITGQINVGIKKPESSEKFFFEYFTNDYLKQEVNLNTSFKINKNLSTIALLHGSLVKNSVDRNDDSFLDVPMSELFIASNRYYYNNGKRIRGRFGVDALFENRQGGQTEFVSKNETPGLYGVTIQSKRFSFFENTGVAINPDRNSSFAINSNIVFHEQNSAFGNSTYNANQLSTNITALFISDVINENHKISGGLNFVSDRFEEELSDTLMNQNEMISGAFTEYTFNNKNNLTIISGLRFNYDFNYGLYFIPRMHIRYAMSDNSAFRLSVGRGVRTAHVIPEHISLMATSRALIFINDLKPETAWNIGGSFMQSFYFSENRKLDIHADFYHTTFQNRVILDMDSDPSKAIFSNLNGKSYSNSFQTNVTIHPYKKVMKFLWPTGLMILK